MSPEIAANTAEFSPLVLADRLLTLAKQADVAGYGDIASTLVWLTEWALEQHPPRLLPRRPGRARTAEPFCGVPARAMVHNTWGAPHVVHTPL